MRWVASMVAEVYRILVRGGVSCIRATPRIRRKPGRLRLLYEANPMAMIVEQAGGARVDRPRASARRRPRQPAPARAGHFRIARGSRALDRLSRRLRPRRGSRLRNAAVQRAFAVPHPPEAEGHDVRQASRHRHHRIVRRRNDDGQHDVRAHLPPRAGINAAVVEGDAFHRYDRAEMRADRSSAQRRRAPALQPFRPRGQPLRRTRERSFAPTARTAPAGRANTSTTTSKRRRTNSRPGRSRRGKTSRPAPTCCSTKACTARS